MKGIAKSSTNKKADMKEAAVDIRGLSGPAREVEDMADEIDDRYEDGLKEVIMILLKAMILETTFQEFFIKKKYADGGAIGIEVLLEEENPRQGLFMGGSPLTGQALSIYNSMKAYNFSDQEIANALTEQGLYTPGSSTPVVEEPVTNIAPNIINQGGDGGITNSSGGPTGSSFFGGLNKNDYEADAYGIGPTFSGSFARTKQGLTNFASALKNIPTPINLARMAYESYQQKQIEKRAQEEAIARDIARDMQESNRAGKTGGYQAGYDRDFMDGPSGGGGGGNSGGTGSAGRGGASPGSSGPGGSDSMGSFARGGLAAMFKKKR